MEEEHEIENEGISDFEDATIEKCVQCYTHSQEIEILKEMLQLKQKISQYETILNSQFTPGQFMRFLNPNKITYWNQEDISSAITIKINKF